MVLAYVVTVLEFGGGLLLLAGLLSRLVGLLLAIHMLFTSFVVKVGKLDVPLIAEQGTGWELDIVLFAAFVAIVLLGPGSLSLDAAVGIEQREAGRAPGDRRTPLRS
jgi:putative oxidoreductase